MVQKGDLTVSGGSFHPAGNPPVDTSKNFSQLKSLINFDWTAIMTGNAIPADVTIPGGTFPPAPRPRA